MFTSQVGANTQPADLIPSESRAGGSTEAARTDVQYRVYSAADGWQKGKKQKKQGQKWAVFQAGEQILPGRRESRRTSRQTCWCERLCLG